MSDKHPIEELREIVKRLPPHSCAYCGGGSAGIRCMKTVASEIPAIGFDIYCPSCGKTDTPILFHSELLSILMSIG